MTATANDRRCISLSAIALCLVSVLLLSGCNRGSRRTISRLESRIRAQETEIAELKQTLDRNEAELAAARREASDLRVTLTAGEQPAVLPEQAAAWFRIESIRINSLLSGGLDRDNVPGDETLAVLISPEDSSGEPLRTAGAIDLTAYDFASDQQDRVVGRWSFSEDESRELWHSGVIGRGLQIRVPLTKWPTADRIFVHARLTTPDGRQFDTNEMLRVTPQSKAVRKVASPLRGEG